MGWGALSGKHRHTSPSRVPTTIHREAAAVCCLNLPPWSDDCHLLTPHGYGLTTFGTIVDWRLRNGLRFHPCAVECPTFRFIPLLAWRGGLMCLPLTQINPDTTTKKRRSGAY